MKAEKKKRGGVVPIEFIQGDRWVQQMFVIGVFDSISLSARSKLLHKINSDSNLGFRRLYSGDTDFLVLGSLSQTSTHIRITWRSC